MRVRLLLSLFVFSLLSVPIAGAETSSMYTGDFTSTLFRAEGILRATTGTPMAVVIDASPGQNASSSWTLTADQLTVNWTHERSQAVGDSSSDPEGSLYSHAVSTTRGEEQYRSAAAAHRANHALANQLVVFRHGSAALQTTGVCFAENPSAEAWWGGRSSNGSTAAGPGALEAAFQVPAQAVVVRCPGGRAELNGDFDLYVWRGDVEITSSPVTYQTGVWYTNATGTSAANQRGVIREEHAQLLRMEVNGGRLSLDQSAGLFQMSSDSFQLAVQGLARFEQADGRIETATEWYRLEGSAVEFSGTTAVEVVSEPESDVLRARKFQSVADDVAAVPELTLSEAKARPGVARQVSGSFKAVTGGAAAPWWFIGGVAVAIAACVAGARLLPVRPHADALLAFAANELESNNPAGARDAAARALRGNRGDPRALLLLAATYMQEGDPQGAIDVLEPYFGSQSGDERATFAYVMAMALARLGREDEAKRWRGAAEENPKLRRLLREEGDRPAQARSEGAERRTEIAYV